MGSRLLASVHMASQTSNQRVKYNPAAWGRAKVLVHRNPYAKLEIEGRRQHAPQVGIAPRQRHLANADAEAGFDGHQVRNVAVGPEAKTEGFEAGHTLQHGMDRRRPMVETDRLVIAKAFEMARDTAAFEISPMRMKA